MIATPRLDKGEVTFPPQGVGKGRGKRERQAPQADKSASAKRRREKFGLRATAAKLLIGESVSRCGQYAAWQGGTGGDGFVSIKMGERGAHWSGVVTCKSVWHCPVCAAKIASGRRDEVRSAIDQHEAAGGVVYMATMTMPHHAFDAFKPLRQGVSAAFTKTIQGRRWVQAREAAGYVGMIRALEVTHGANGWHPHLHVLVLLDSDVNAGYFGAALFARWAAAVERMGFGKCSRNAWRFEKCVSADDAGDYVAKWGPDYELTHGHMKEAKGGGRSPWAILRDYEAGADPRDAELFREYAHGSKGARQLTWSNGLKARFGLKDVDDAAHADAEPEARTIVEVSQDVLRYLVKRRLAARVLEIVETEGVEALRRFLDDLDIAYANVRFVETPPDPPTFDDLRPALADLLRLPLDQIRPWSRLDTIH